MLDTNIRCKQVWKQLDTKGFKENIIYSVDKGRLILPDGSKSETQFESIDDINESYYAVFEEETNENNQPVV